VVLSIKIAHPWWNTWWMWLVYLCLLVLAFYGALRVYQLHNKYMRLVVDDLNRTSTVDNNMVITNNQEESDDESNQFITKATKIVVDNISDSDFNIDRMCREMAMSRTLFYVKLKSYTGKSPQDFIRIIRLERAAQMLRNGSQVTDAASMTGFDNPKYFSTVFKKYFGISPSKYY
jgi:AraC-like DNA-binding protein